MEGVGSTHIHFRRVLQAGLCRDNWEVGRDPSHCLPTWHQSFNGCQPRQGLPMTLFVITKESFADYRGFSGTSLWLCICGSEAIYAVLMLSILCLCGANVDQCSGSTIIPTKY